MTNDLQSSGLFEVIDRRAYIQTPEELRQPPRFADWRLINAQALVTGNVQAEPGAPMGVEFRLWDVFAGEQMRGLKFDAPESQWRRIAHKIADVIYERLTGEPGYFDTRITYIAESGPPREAGQARGADGAGRQRQPLPDRRHLPGADPALLPGRQPDRLHGLSRPPAAEVYRSTSRPAAAACWAISPA